jgi:hypothetical protein
MDRLRSACGGLNSLGNIFSRLAFDISCFGLISEFNDNVFLFLQMDARGGILN